MTYTRDYADTEPTLAAINATAGVTLLEFGAHQCGFCVAVQPAVAQAFAERADDAAPILHHKIADGAGQPLGRAFRIKLWPTLVLLRDGEEVGRVVRPGGVRDIRVLLDTLAI